MTIKKPIKAADPVMEAVPGELPAVSATPIPDHLKLDVPAAPVPVKKTGGVGAAIALVAALLALGVAGILTFIIYQHWEFLQGA